jgi:hypothetical protein
MTAVALEKRHSSRSSSRCEKRFRSGRGFLRIAAGR